MNLLKARNAFRSKFSFNTRLYLTLGSVSSIYGYMCYKSRNLESEPLRIGVAGSLAVISIEVAYFPIDLVNNRSKLSAQNVGTLKALRSILANEGIASLFQGTTPICYGAIVYGFAYFWIYKYLKKVNRDYFEKRNMLSLMYFLVAGISDCLALLIYFPFEVVTLRMQWWSEEYKYRGLADGFADIYKSHGPLGIYKGYTPYVLNYVTNYSIQFMLYEDIISYIKLNIGHDFYYKYDDPIVLATSMLCGFVGSGLTNWFEVFAVRKQANMSESTIDVIRDLGFKIFTSGIKVRVFYHTFQAIGLFYSLHLFGKLYNVELNDD